jgi:tRNA G10  N-methylase Trm11
MHTLMHTYYSTFIPGFSKGIEKALKEYANVKKTDLLHDGLVVYETESPPEKIAELPFFNNSFLLIEKLFEDGTLENIISKVIENRTFQIPEKVKKDKKTFRIITSKENILTSIPKNDLEELEYIFSKKLQMEVDRANPDVEIWFLERREGTAFCGVRLTKKPSTEKYLQKGELRPELAWLLNFLSEPSKNDAFLDPFTGHGSIPIARTMFPYKKIMAGDKDELKVNTLNAKNKNFETTLWDAEHLPLDKESINKIVTDPPWGMYEEDNVDMLYTQMLDEFARILKPGGILILLTAQKDLMEKLLHEKADIFELKETYHILVSGKKAAVYKIWKK